MHNSESGTWSHTLFVIGVLAVVLGILMFFFLDRLVLDIVTYLGPLLIAFGIVFMLLDLAAWREEKAGEVEQR